MEMTPAPVSTLPDPGRPTATSTSTCASTDRGWIRLGNTPVPVGTNLAGQRCGPMSRAMPSTAVVTVEGIGVLLDQTQTNTLAIIAAQAEAQALAQAPRPDGQSPGVEAAAGLLRILSDLVRDGRTEIDRSLDYLSAAVLHYARTGNLITTGETTVEMLGGGRVVNLGEWVDSLLSGPAPAPPGWARPILEALGMTDLPPSEQTLVQLLEQVWRSLAEGAQQGAQTRQALEQAQTQA